MVERDQKQQSGSGNQNLQASNTDNTLSSSNDLTQSGYSKAVPSLVLPYQDSSTSNNDLAIQNSPTSPLPQFQSALNFTQVRDFAYPEFHPLFYGVSSQLGEASSRSSYNEGDGYDDGPPWQEDDDLASPIVKSHEVGDRISREYEFSVSSVDEVHGRAVALFDFEPENENEAPLREGQIIWVSYRHGQGWLVAEVDPETGEAGLVPEGYVEMIPPEEARRIQEEQLERQRLEQQSLDSGLAAHSALEGGHSRLEEERAKSDSTEDENDVYQSASSEPHSGDESSSEAMANLKLDK